ncbi:MAG: DNA primase [Candidatus Bruticola sp.]
MKIPEETISEISNRIDISTVIGRYLQLRRSGGKYLGLCPFHNEKTPSFSVDPDRGFWYCFGCRQGGNVFQFLMKIEGMGFPEAVKKLAAEAGVEIKLQSDESAGDTSRQRSLQLLERITGYYSRILFETEEGRPGREYLKKRRISKSVAQKFRLGFAPGNSARLLQAVRRSGFNEEDLLRSGVFVKKERGLRELLNGRLIFPIADFQGRIIAMGGRILGDGLPKYINSPETELYSKRFHLYGLNVARGAISRENRAILTEGYLDVISMHQIGIDCCIASLGTALTADQAKLLKRYTKQVVLAYDGDTAGAKAIISGSAILEEAGLQVMTVSWPDGEDPDSMSAKGRQAVDEILNEKVGIVKFKIDRLLKTLDTTTPEGKEDLVKNVLPFIMRIQDPVRRNAYVSELAYYSGFSENKLLIYLNRSRRALPRAPEYKAKERVLTSAEKLFSLCTSHPEWIKEAKALVEPDYVENDGLRLLFAKLWHMEERTKPITVNELLDEECDQTEAERLSELMAYDRLSSDTDDIRKLATDIRNEHLKKRLESLKCQVLKKLESGTLSNDDPLYVEYIGMQKKLRTGGL